MSESSSERDPVEEFLARCRCSQRPDLREYTNRNDPLATGQYGPGLVGQATAYLRRRLSSCRWLGVRCVSNDWRRPHLLENPLRTH